MLLFRPVNLDELRLTYQKTMGRVVTHDGQACELCPEASAWYASGMARDTSATHPSRAGFVLRITVPDDCPEASERRSLGPPRHEAVWLPPERLASIDTRLEGRIEVIEAFFGLDYRGFVPDRFGLRGRDATQQFVELARMIPQAGFDFQCEVAANHVSIFLNYFFWEQPQFRPAGIAPGVRDRTLRLIRKVWAHDRKRGIPLGLACSLDGAPA